MITDEQKYCQMESETNTKWEEAMQLIQLEPHLWMDEMESALVLLMAAGCNRAVLLLAVTEMKLMAELFRREFVEKGDCNESE